MSQKESLEEKQKKAPLLQKKAAKQSKTPSKQNKRAPHCNGCCSSGVAQASDNLRH
jgi:hypothetical protein